MTNAAESGRTDSASVVIEAPAPTIYAALVDPEALVRWRPPAGMTGTMFEFDARPGGRFRMALTYADAQGHGKTTGDTDVIEGRFLELVPGERVVELVTFESDDPRFAGEMTITTTLELLAAGTRVTVRCDNVPPGISASDHEEGLTSTLKNLAAFTERA